MKKRIVSLVLAGAMAAALLAGCGASEETALTGSGSATDEADDEEEEDSGEIVEIELYGMTLYGTDGLEEVEAAVNEISEAEIGVHVNITLLDMASYAEQTNLMFASQDQMDLMMTTLIPAAGFASLTSQNQLTALNDLLPEYAPELYEMMGELLDGTTISGNIYAVPDYRNLLTNAYVLMRADILDDLGLREAGENLDSWTEYQEILQAVVDSGYDDGKVSACIGNTDSDGSVITVQYGILGSDDWSEHYMFDSLGDTYQIVAVDEETDTVYSFYESEEYYNMITLMTELYNDGYVYKDAATSDESGDTLISNDVVFSEVVAAQSNVVSDRLSSTGYEVVAAEVAEGNITTTNATAWTWAIPVTAAEPEAAMEFMNLMYTNEEISNLFVWGIEGRDYEVNEEGEAVTLDTVEYQSSDWLWGNQFQAYPAEGAGGDYRETAEAEMEDAVYSEYYGCMVDTANISNELTAVYNVILQYKPGYDSGSVSAPATYEEYYNGEFCTALRAAGVDTIVQEYQTQLDEWIAEQ